MQSITSQYRQVDEADIVVVQMLFLANELIFCGVLRYLPINAEMQ